MPLPNAYVNQLLNSTRQFEWGINNILDRWQGNIVQKNISEVIEYAQSLKKYNFPRRLGKGTISCHLKYGEENFTINLPEGTLYFVPLEYYECDGLFPSLEKALNTYITERNRLTVIQEQFRALVGDIIDGFGSIKYALTQFPELRSLIEIPRGIENVYNKSYKIKTRDMFNNPDAITIGLSELAVLRTQHESR